MAAPTRILSLSLGTQTIGLAEFKTGQNGGLVLASYEARELLADPAADATRLAQARLLLNELVQSRKLKGSKVNYAVSSQSVFTRFVKLPSVGEEQVDQIVGFEAQQNVPYPIDEVVWDYQLVDSGDSAQVEVVIVAIKADLLDDINDAVEQSALKTTLVDVAPMAVYNAFRYNYSDVPGCSLIIDIGSRTTNLIFLEPHKVFSRSIPNGGSTITQQIAKEFNEPFQAAEERKKRDGFVSLGGAYAEPEDPEIARVSKMIRNSMTRLHAEIARSISFYRSQQGGSQPERVYLSGGCSTLPYMREFFQEKFQLPVEFFNPLRNVAVGSNLNVDDIGRNAHRMGELIGLALRGTSNCPMELNLRPASVVRRQALAVKRPYLILAGLCALLAVTAWYLYFTQAAKATDEASQKLAPKIVELQRFEKLINTAKSDIKAQQDTATPFLNAVDERSYWVQIIDDINARLPRKYVWITSFDIAPPEKNDRPAGGGGPGGQGNNQAKKGSTLLLKGLYLFNDRQASVVDDFTNKLSESTLYTVDKDHMKRSVPNDLTWAYEFELPLILKTTINAPSPREMNWVKQNKFLTGFIIVMVIGLGALGYLAFSASSVYEESANQYTQKSAEYNRLRSLKPFPSKKNLDAFDVQKKEALAAITAFQADLAKKEFPLEQVSPIEFQDRLKAAVTDVRTKAKESNIVLGSDKEKTDKFYLGFDRYETTPPATEAAAPLARQLKAVKWVVDQFIASQAAQIDISRPELPEEKGKTNNKGGNNPGGNKPGGPGNGKAAREGRSDLVDKRPFDIVIVTKQERFSSVLNIITGASAPQFYIPGTIRIENEHPTGPLKADPNAQSAAAAPAGEAPKPVMGSYIVGEEQIKVQMRLEIVNFSPITPEK